MQNKDDWKRACIFVYNTPWHELITKKKDPIICYYENGNRKTHFICEYM